MIATAFCVKLTAGGGPPPFLELERVARVAEEHPDGVTWLATRKRGTKIRIDGGSTCLAFAVSQTGHVRLLEGRITGRTERLPENGLLSDMYVQFLKRTGNLGGLIC
jgi:hypothetical protein